MSALEWTEWIRTVAAVITLCVVAWNARLTKKVETQSNSMKDELVKEVRKAAYAKGKKDEKENTP